MAPEQFVTADVDPRADVYSAGMTLYECYAGRLPFDGAPLEIAAAVSNGRKPIPLRQLVPDAPEALERALARAIARDREMRFPE